jgi:hypothetical protein
MKHPLHLLTLAASLLMPLAATHAVDESNESELKERKMQ